MIEPDWVETEIAAFTALLETEFEAAKSYLPNKADWFEGALGGPQPAAGRDHRAPQRLHRSLERDGA